MKKAFAKWLEFLGCDEETATSIMLHTKGPQLWAYVTMNIAILLLAAIAISFGVFAIFGQ